jgi:hypothetical protein
VAIHFLLGVMNEEVQWGAHEQSSEEGGGEKPPCKKQFSVGEDRAVVMFVGLHGARNWALLASHMPNRTAKQCRERWHNHLNPSINRGPWSLEEDVTLVRKQLELGNRWADIARYLPGRTDTLVKNRWNTSLKCRLDEFRDMPPVKKQSDEDRRLLPPISSFDFGSIPSFLEGTDWVAITATSV